MLHDDTIYKFSIKLSFFSIGQAKITETNKFEESIFNNKQHSHEMETITDSRLQSLSQSLEFRYDNERTENK